MKTTSCAVRDEGVLRAITEVDLTTCDPGTMLYVDLDRDGSSYTLYATIIIPMGNHTNMIHGVSLMGLPADIEWRHGPKSQQITRHLKVGEPLHFGLPSDRASGNLGEITKLQIWSGSDYQPGS